MTAMNFGIGQSELGIGNAGKTGSREDVLRTITEIKALGGTAIRFSCLWMQLDPGFGEKYRNTASGLAAWDTLDYCIDQSELAGLDILLLIEPRKNIAPIGSPATQKNATAYGKLCGKIAERYGDRVKWYEICNEVNSIAFFGGGKSPSKYVEFLREAYNNITPFAPGALIAAGALMGAVGNSFGTLTSPEWVAGFYRAEPQAYFHVLSTHPYVTKGDFSPIPVTPDSLCFKNLEAVRALMDANGDAAKPILLTEWGFESMSTVYGAKNQAEIEAEQALKLDQQWAILQTYVDNGTIYPTVFVFDLRDWDIKLKKPMDHYGMFRFDWTKKPVWQALRNKALQPVIDAPVALATGTGLPPEVTVYVDESRPIAPVALGSGTGLEPTVIVPVLAPVAVAAGSGLTPTVMVTSTSVEFVSAGTGDRDTSGGDDITLTWTHNVTQPGLLLTGLGTSSSTGSGWESYSPFTVTSSLDGDFVRTASRHIGASSVKRGSANVFQLNAVTVGTHTMTARVKKTGLGLAAVAANSVLVSGAAGVGTVASNGSTTGGNTPTVTIASAVDDLVLFVLCANDLGGFTGADVRYYDGSLVLGNGDYVLIATAPGASSVNVHTNVSLAQFAAIAINLPAA